MKTSSSISLILLSAGLLGANSSQDTVQKLATAPLRFEPAADGQRFAARGIGYRFTFSGNQVAYRTDTKSVRLQFEGAARTARIEGVERLRSASNIFIGNDQSKWRRAVPNYARLRVHELYPGIDAVYYGNAGELEYDLTVKPGADPRQIRLRVDGASARIDAQGNLAAEIIQKRPFAYQIAADGTKLAVASRYRRNADGSYGLVLGQYDARRELTIDPVLTFSGYVAGSSQDVAYRIGHDGRGLIYVGGTTFSTDFAIAGSPLQTAPGGGNDIFLTVIDPKAPAGAQILYTTYLGGSSDETLGGMLVSRNGDVYMTGSTASSNFPTANAAQGSISGTNTSDVFIAWFDVFQTLLYSSYLGGSGNDVGIGIATDSRGRMWVTGGTASNDFPTAGGFQTFSAGGGQDIFIAGIDPSQSGSGTLIYSTYLGGTSWDVGRGIAVASDGTLWIVGGTYSNDIALAALDFQPDYAGGGDAYVVHIDPSRSDYNAVVYGTYLGSSGLEEARSIVLDASGRVVVSGYTLSPNFPTTSNALQPQYGGNADIFVSILDPTITSSRSGQLVYSTYFGGTDADIAFDLKQDSNGILYLAGFTLSAGLPTKDDALQRSYDGTMDAFALEIDPAKSGTSGLRYFTYLGSPGLQIAYGIDFDASGNLYLAGFTSGSIFSAFGAAGKPTDPGNGDAFVIGFNPGPPTVSTN